MHPAPAGKHQRPRYPRKATAPPYAAASDFWLGCSTLLGAARVPLQPFNCCPHQAIPPPSRNGDCSHIAEGRLSLRGIGLSTKMSLRNNSHTSGASSPHLLVGDVVRMRKDMQQGKQTPSKFNEPHRPATIQVPFQDSGCLEQAKSSS